MSEAEDLIELRALRERVRELEAKLVRPGHVSPGGELAHQAAISLMRNSKVFFSLYDRDGKILYLNYATDAYDLSKIVGTSVLSLCKPHCHAALKEAIADVFDNRCQREVLGEDINSDWYSNHLGPVIVNDCVVAVSNVTEDITARIATEEKLRRSESRWRSLLMSVPDTVVQLNSDGEVLHVTNKSENYSEVEVVGRPGDDFVAPEFREAAIKARSEVLANGGPIDFEFREVSGRWFLARMGRLVIEREVNGLVAVCRDITEAKQRQKDLETAVEQQTRELLDANTKLKQGQESLKRLVELHERDRQLIAYEIHDGLVQDMAGALMFIDTATGIAETDQNRAMLMCERGKQVLRGAVDEARRLIDGLRPPVLDNFGLIAALSTQLQDMEAQYDIKIDFHHDVQFERLAPAIETAIYRIVIESANNFCRHSQSPSACISLVQDAELMHIQVQDSGIGFDTTITKERRFGLLSIRERARLLGGEAKIISQPGSGTLVQVELPLADMLFRLEDLPLRDDDD